MALLFEVQMSEAIFNHCYTGVLFLSEDRVLHLFLRALCLLKLRRIPPSRRDDPS